MPELVRSLYPCTNTYTLARSRGDRPDPRQYIAFIYERWCLRCNYFKHPHNMTKSQSIDLKKVTSLNLVKTHSIPLHPCGGLCGNYVMSKIIMFYIESTLTFNFLLISELNKNNFMNDGQNIPKEPHSPFFPAFIWIIMLSFQNVMKW